MTLNTQQNRKPHSRCFWGKLKKAPLYATIMIELAISNLLSLVMIAFIVAADPFASMGIAFYLSPMINGVLFIAYLLAAIILNANALKQDIRWAFICAFLLPVLCIFSTVFPPFMLVQIGITILIAIHLS